ncbi:MAG: hypothetical protein JST84_18550 [Acidobacteria bacterium]|nr:hypothetical protein [Acidobacteriota bacterium]
MKTKIISLLFSVLAIVALPVVSYGQETATAEESKQENNARSQPPKTCSVRTLKGAYGFLIKGAILNLPGLPSGPTATIGIITYDGTGNLTSTNTSSFNGFVLTQEMTGTYTVNSDCTGTVQSGPTTADIVITNNGREVRSIGTYPAGVAFPPGAGWIIEAIGKKIAPEPRDNTWREHFRAANFTCNPQNVAGEYAVKAAGTVLNALPLPAGPALGLSKIILNEAGQSAVKGTFNFNGTIVPVVDTATGTDLKPDCTSTAKQTANGAIQKIVFVNGGTEFFFLQLPPEGTPNIPGVGAVFYGEGKRIREAEKIGVRW